MKKIYLFILFALGSGLVLNSCKKEATNSAESGTNCLVSNIKNLLEKSVLNTMQMDFLPKEPLWQRRMDQF